MHGGEQIAGVREVGRSRFGGRRVRGGDAEFGQQRAVQSLLDRHGVRRVPREHPRRAGIRRPARDGGESGGVPLEIEPVLDDEKRERLRRERAISEPGDKRVFQDGGVDIADALPEFIGERSGHGATLRRPPLLR
jgi:hypothetical protein